MKIRNVHFDTVKNPDRYEDGEVGFNSREAWYIRQDPFTGKLMVLEVACSDPMQLATLIFQYHRGTAGTIQAAFPFLDASAREFIKTGISPEGWAMLPSEE